MWSTPSAAFERYAEAAEEQSGSRIVRPPLSTPFVTSASSGLPPGRPISCYTYGVPCVASLDLGAYCHGLVVSTVHNYDLVPTLSLGVLRDFKAMAMGFYAEQGVCEEIVGRVIGLCQRRFMARRAARKAAGSSSSSPAPAPAPHPGASEDSSESCGPESLTDPAEESRLVPLSNDEISAGRGSNKALEPAYQDPGLLGHDLVADDLELSNWLWSLRTTIRASSDSEKLYPPGASPLALAPPSLAPPRRVRHADLAQPARRLGLRYRELHRLHLGRVVVVWAILPPRGTPGPPPSCRRRRAPVLRAHLQPHKCVHLSCCRYEVDEH